MHPSGPSRYTAYAFRWGPDMFVSVDEFYYTGNGVRLTIDPLQLRWLAQRFSTARANGVRHIIVQGHLPVTEGYPRVPLPYRGSSRLMLEDRGLSPFWQLLHRYHVDLYLAGEFHAVSVRHYLLYQVVNGCVAWYPCENYLVGDVYPDRIVVTVKQFSPTYSDDTFMWQMPREPGGFVRAHVNYEPKTTVVTTLTIPRY